MTACRHARQRMAIKGSVASIYCTDCGVTLAESVDQEGWTASAQSSFTVTLGKNVDAETVLRKYIAHIADRNGVTFLDDHHRTQYTGDTVFEDEEWEYLKRIAGE